MISIDSNVNSIEKKKQQQKQTPVFRADVFH